MIVQLMMAASAQTLQSAANHVLAQNDSLSSMDTYRILVAAGEPNSDRLN
jgi:hypothetical protein